ncbi:hypothetical protein MA16_Dca029152 [Dendrobium catenatum]|uniref:Uncharacterized protein n=1 Tax=Dendrobium catenatum TaxID=906689 RepID=A0A2I0VF94_9ASPA|nr:hypothetical protein MA16_Dca029152 [Dendrobium catenatum]
MVKKFEDIDKVFKLLNFKKCSSFTIPVNWLEETPKNSSLGRYPRVNGRVPLS